MDARAARARYGRVLVVELGGAELLFRPLGVAEASTLAKAVAADPDDCLDECLAACEAAYVGPRAALEAAVDAFPLAFGPQDGGVAGALLKLATGDAKLRVQKGAALWKRADRNPGLMAEHLLAFKAYQGGEYGEAEFAGALTIAEWMGSTKGIFLLFSALLKALSKRR